MFGKAHKCMFCSFSSVYKSTLRKNYFNLKENTKNAIRSLLPPSLTCKATPTKNISLIDHRPRRSEKYITIAQGSVLEKHNGMFDSKVALHTNKTVKEWMPDTQKTHEQAPNVWVHRRVEQYGRHGSDGQEGEEKIAEE